MILSDDSFVTVDTIRLYAITHQRKSRFITYTRTLQRCVKEGGWLLMVLVVIEDGGRGIIAVEDDADL